MRPMLRAATIASQLRAGDHFGHDSGCAELVGLAPEGRIGHARHRRQENRRSDLDISYPEHETVSPHPIGLPNL